MQSEIQHLLKTVKFVHHLFHNAKAGVIQSARAEGSGNIMALARCGGAAKLGSGQQGQEEFFQSPAIGGGQTVQVNPHMDSTHNADDRATAHNRVQLTTEVQTNADRRTGGKDVLRLDQ
jgi:hypothetical protein